MAGRISEIRIDVHGKFVALPPQPWRNRDLAETVNRQAIHSTCRIDTLWLHFCERKVYSTVWFFFHNSIHNLFQLLLVGQIKFVF